MIRGIIYPALLVMLWLVFFVLPIGNRGLWQPDEPRYVQVAWEMWQAGSYVVPLMNGEIYAQKPPLFFWLIILFSKVFSFETASRWVSALSSLGTVLLTYLLGRQVGDKELGFTASLVLMSCGLYTLLVTTGNIDTTLTFFTTLSLYLYLKWDAQKKGRFLTLSYAACGLGILAKGPVALVVPWLAYAIWEIFKYCRRENASFHHLIWGPLLALVITSAWLMPACILGGDEYTQTILFTQNLGRAIKSQGGHIRPWYYYFTNLPYLTLPWFIVFLGGIPQLRRLTDDKNRAFSILIIWVCTAFIFFSLISGKRDRYLLPAFPVFSLIIAHILAKWDGLDKCSTWVRIVGILALVVGIALLIFPSSLPLLKDKYSVLKIFPLSVTDWRLWAIYGSGILAAATLWKGFDLARRRQNVRACRLIAIALLVLFGMYQIYYIPCIEPVKSVKQACEEMKTILPADGTIAFYKKRYDNGWNFYLNRAEIPVITVEELKQNQPRFDVILLRKKHLQEFQAMIPQNNYQIASIAPVGSKEFVLLKSGTMMIKGHADLLKSSSGASDRAQPYN
jgi:4-amino-4-deoxy-L-arabinose transferase-like glycosyltransferase